MPLDLSSASAPLRARRALLIAGSVACQSLAWVGMTWAALSEPLSAHFPWIHLGYLFALACFGAQTVFWLLALRVTPLSVAYPFMALTIPLNIALSVVIFGERVGLQAIAGLALLTAGVAIVASGARS